MASGAHGGRRGDDGGAFQGRSGRHRAVRHAQRRQARYIPWQWPIESSHCRPLANRIVRLQTPSQSNRPTADP
eukprot:9471370-Pyramimonas_sp.AAC.2